MIKEREKLLEELSTEYGILQDKIDKIGAFRFTVKGWSLTIIAASVVAGGLTKVSPRWVAVGILSCFSAVFFIVEKVQTDLSRSFGRRARLIEGLMTNMLRFTPNGSRLDEFRGGRHVPGIARDLGATHASLFARLTRSIRRWGKARDHQSILEFLDGSLWTKLKECWDADIWFYIFQILVLLVASWKVADHVDQPQHLVINTEYGTGVERESQKAPQVPGRPPVVKTQAFKSEDRELKSVR